MENDEIQVDVTPDTSNEEVELTLEDEATPEPTVDWQAEALKLKAINQRLSKKIGTPESKQDLQKTQKTDVSDDIKKTVEQLALAETKRQFGYQNGLSPEETDAVFGFNPNPTKETLKNPFVEGGLAKLRSQKRINENTPSSSSRSGKQFSIKPDATLAERQAEHERWTKNWQPRR